MELPKSPRKDHNKAWDENWRDDWNDPVAPLTREQAQALMAQEPPVSPWRVVLAQVVVGAVVACLVWAFTGRVEGFWSALYGAAAVVVPAMVLARGVTSRLSNVNAATAAVSFMLWQSLKISVSVVMLMLAPHIVPMLMWPALLVGLVVCIKVYWVALLWRRTKPQA